MSALPKDSLHLPDGCFFMGDPGGGLEMHAPKCHHYVSLFRFSGKLYTENTMRFFQMLPTCLGLKAFVEARKIIEET
jgi:hypothetical protein